ncbi:glycosyltransferase family 2 protein [Rhizobium sp. ARZ01]|uniref:glycosyltransferase family 2 protein n=1 Tax=Rhizobium sp. ARZ01 TaxID=2769313 RepID=UPI00177CEF0F|nr:glycosyltransferase family 2 protein [Rhizobium sp. ARZ01]MBD9375023.1 glycosyltransferase family 2 protein [Rhizobium sp. ARZ01]
MNEPTRDAAIEAVVCIPTFRRPEWLRKTLLSVLAQKTDFPFALVVIDNDGASPAGALVAREILGERSIAHVVEVEHEQGNCHAINTAFRLALERYSSARYLLMIDDDETADGAWLQNMVHAARENGADIVGGPVFRTFETPASSAIRNHSLFSSIDGISRAVPMIHGSGNCLIGRHVFERTSFPFFDLRFNFLGGGDMEFFTRCRLAGYRFWWCAEALIDEIVPADRANAKWLMTRSIRTGSINCVIDRLHMGRYVAPKVIAKNLVSLSLGLVRSLTILASTGQFLPATHPFLMSVGRMAPLLGLLPKPYQAKS